MTVPQGSNELTELTDEEIAVRELDLRREKAQREKASLNKIDEWECTTANRGKFRIFWLDTYDGDRGRHGDWSSDPEKSKYEWDSFEEAKEHIAEQRQSSPHSSENYFIFDDVGRQIWLDSYRSHP